MLLNVTLLVVTLVAAWRVRSEWQAAKERERKVLVRKPSPAPALSTPPVPAPKPVVPAGYIDIAKNMLFSKDRNSTVIVPPPPPPPAPPPMPALPVLHGVMNIGDGPMAILSEKANTAHHDIRPGEKFGEFTLLAVNNQEIVLEWNGQQVRRRLDELLDRSAAAAPQQAASPPGVTPAAPAAPAPPAVKAGPGVDIGNGIKACVAGDTSPVGSVVDGLKKVTWDTPFGKGCRWDPVK